ncbi:MAG: response regulator [Chloroflexi bacterium]|nr:response regulator [Chloroflexota bacterium]
MPVCHKLLILDDDQDVLDLYREMLSHLPSQPDVHTATSGARAIALLESEPFTLLLSDLKMPKMDGLQVLAIVRRKFPQLRTAVMTSVADEQFRARAYAMGVDLFVEKPSTSKEITFFLDCIESLLGREVAGGFRGVQSKSLVDIIQLECLSQSSSVLKITNSLLEGRIWIQNGEAIDAAVEDLAGEAAFQKILSWKTGNFEILPAEPARKRTIFNSYQGLLLETAQALDEAQAGESQALPGPEAAAEGKEPASPLAALARFQGVEFVLMVRPAEKEKVDSWGLENPDQVAHFVGQTLAGFRALGERLQVGQLSGLEGMGLQRHLAIASCEEAALCGGFRRSLARNQVQETMKRMVAKWVS